MERLMKTELYQRNDEGFESFGHYNPKFVTKLITNYRSDQQIMKCSDDRFYMKELVFSYKSNKSLLEKMKLKSTLVFHGLVGKDQREEDSPSWFNLEEAEQCIWYLKEMLAVKIPIRDICIITPYRKQVRLLKLLKKF